jgi:hypothetical protein
MVVLERMQARTSPVPLEPATAGATPDHETREAAKETLPDAPGSVAGH